MDQTTFSRHSIVAVPEGGTKISISLRGHRIVTDQPGRAGGTDAGPTPLELLGASLSACVALYVQQYCDAQGIVADDLAVEVRPFWRDNPGRVARYDIILHLPDTIAAEHHADIQRVAQACPVHHTLTLTPEITLQLRAPSLVGE